MLQEELQTCNELLQEEQLQNKKMSHQNSEQSTLLQHYKVQLAELSEQLGEMTQKGTTQQEQLEKLQEEHTSLVTLYMELTTAVHQLVHCVSKEMNMPTTALQVNNFQPQQVIQFQRDVITMFNTMQTQLQENSIVTHDVQILQTRMRTTVDTISNEIGLSLAVPTASDSDDNFEQTLLQLRNCLRKFAEAQQEEVSLLMKWNKQELDVELQQCKRDLRLLEKQLSQESKKAELQEAMMARLSEDSMHNKCYSFSR